jgi:chitinase
MMPTVKSPRRAKARWPLWIVAAVGLALAFVSVQGRAQRPAADAAPTYRVIAYLFGRTDIPAIGAEKLTHINYSFALVSDDGHIVLQGDRAARRLAQLRELRAKHPHLKVMLSVGGWGADNFSDAALTDESRRKFAETAVQLLREHELDGLDVDWEYPGQPGPGIKFRPEDKQNFTLMLGELRRQFDAASRQRWPDGGDQYLLTIASAAGRYFEHTEMDRLHEHLDWINIMTYDMYGQGSRTTGHHTGLYPGAGEEPGARSVQSYVDQHLAAGIPPNKLVIGAAFYGKGWSGVDAASNGLRQKYERFGRGGSYSRLVSDFIDKNGYERHWDEAARAPYLWNPESRSFISYDDPESLAAKAAYVKERGLGGIMFWEYSHDPEERLLDAIVAGLR